MPRFGVVPKEPSRSNDLSSLAPRFRKAVEQILANDPTRIIIESLRSPDRQDWLYGFGRDYDDGRGIVTHAPSLSGWHEYGLAVDIINKSHGWDATHEWWESLGADAERHGCVWGGRWKMRDFPHVQWGSPMRTTPSREAQSLYRLGGVEAVWRAVSAI